MKLFFLVIITAFVFNSSFSVQARAQSITCKNALNVTIKSMNQRLRDNDFGTSRSLSQGSGMGGYFNVFKNLQETLADLSSSQHHWLDLGAGDGLAFLEYYQAKGGQARTTGIVFKETDEFIDSVKAVLPDENTFLSGRLFENIPNHEIGSVDLITDYFGVLSYTHALDVSLNKALDLLKTGGKLMFFHGFGVSHHTNIVMNYIKPNGFVVQREFFIIDFLRRIPGIEVQRTGIADQPFYSIEVTKGPDYVSGSVPSLKLNAFNKSNPPRRMFETTETLVMPPDLLLSELFEGLDDFD